jgi:hypothetical protein
VAVEDAREAVGRPGVQALWGADEEVVVGGETGRVGGERVDRRRPVVDEQSVGGGDGEHAG